MNYGTKSFLRREEYAALSKLSIDGKILDIGGSKKSGYHELIKGEHEILTGNIDSSYDCDVIFDAQKTWPIESNSYEGVLLINVLEHIYAYDACLEETYRVIASGGIVVGVVPFMFNVHGSPSDYFRYTRFTIEQVLKEKGFREIEIQELGTGAFSVIYHCLIGFVKWLWLADLLIPIFRGLDTLASKIKPNNLMSAKYMPLGYLFIAKK